jgi:hypothetical protein
VIRLVLTYGSTVWWPRVRYNFSMTELSKLEIFAGLAITQGLKMNTTAAMVALLGLPPLHVMTDAVAQAGIYRLMCTNGGDLNPLMSVTPKTLKTCSKNPSYR